MENITLGDIQAIIGFLVTFLTSGGIILGIAFKGLKKMLNKEITPFCESMKNEIRKIQIDNQEIHSELKKNSLDTMRIAICSKELPLKERVDIGKRYIENGGNGSVKVLVHTLEEKYEKELKKGEKI